MKIMKLQVEVSVPDTIGENEVETALNAALDEAPGNWDGSSPYWGDWEVGPLVITGVRPSGGSRGES